MRWWVRGGSGGWVKVMNLDIALAGTSVTALKAASRGIPVINDIDADVQQYKIGGHCVIRKQKFSLTSLNNNNKITLKSELLHQESSIEFLIDTL